MGIGERLRRLDDVVVDPPPSPAQRAPAWVRLAAVGVGQWFLLLVYEVQQRTVGGLVATIVYGAVVVPAFVAAGVWQRRHGMLATRGRLAFFAAFPVVIGAAIVTAAADRAPLSSRRKMRR